MKKLLKSALIGVVTLSACMSFTACKDEPIDITMQEIYDANRTATLLDTCDEVGVVYTDLDGSVKTTYLDGKIYYETVTLGETTTSECYDKNGTVGYTLQGTTYYSLLAKEDVLNAKPKKAYENQVFADKDVALQESIVSAVKKNDAIHVRTKLDGENAVAVFTADGYSYRDGEYIQTDYVLEEDTYRVLSAKRIAVRESGATAPYTNLEQKFALHVTTEIADFNARVQAVQSRTNVRKMTVAMDPNTINEELCSAFAVMGDRFQISLGTSYVEFYTDTECKIPYTFTDGDERKQFLKLYAKKVFIPAEYDFTMTDIVRANQTEAWLSAVDSFTVTKEIAGEEVQSVYLDKQKVYINYGSYGVTALTNGGGSYKKTGTEYIAMADDIAAQYDNAVFDEEWAVKESIQYAEERGNKLILTTKLSAEDLQEMNGEYADVDGMQMEYVLDAKTYKAERYAAYILHKDGTKTAAYTVEIAVDTPAEEEANEMYARLTAMENVREIVVIAEPNSMDIKIYRIKAVKGDAFVISGYETLYTDPDCTQVFEDTNRQEDELLLYAKTQA